VYAMLASESSGHEESELIGLIEARGGQISPRQLMHACRQFRSSATAARSYLDSMVHDGLGQWQWKTGDGRPSEVFVLKVPGPGNTSTPLEGGIGNTSPVLDSATGAFVTVTSVTTKLNGDM
jgi:predicted ArsR family transcriptional regulator